MLPRTFYDVAEIRQCTSRLKRRSVELTPAWR